LEKGLGDCYCPDNSTHLVNALQVVKNVCKKCGNALTAESRLLAAIFGDDVDVCSACLEKERANKCVDCGKITSLSMNGMPLCAEHMARRCK